MFESFYGLRSRPFSLLPNPEYLYPSTQHRMALGLLEYALSHESGFVAITGDIGTGKTTLVRYLVGQIQGEVDVGLIVHTHPDFGGLLQWVVEAFGIEAPGATAVEHYRAFAAFLMNRARHGRRALLIVDEGQNLGQRGLEELRTLSNLNITEQLLQIILVGQPRLRELLRSPELEQFAQRICVDYHLGGLSREDSDGYVLYRLCKAGAGNRCLFDEEALARVHLYSRGVPRLINVICDAALVYGYALQRSVIGGAIIEEVVRDRLRGGVLPLPSISDAIQGA